MPLPDIEQHRADKLLTTFCDKRVPPHARGHVKMTYKLTGNKAILIESRPYYDDPTKWTEMPIAQFEYSATSKSWSLYAYNRNDKRMAYAKGPLEYLIKAVDQDPTGIFWG
ncbi:DUF3024 domain-containing protein [Geomonas subterranea]